jgi:NADPH:quinone reductase-like Zn-dependent oxidoreductase
MQAIYCTRYGAPDVLELREVAVPKLKNGHVLVNIYATAVTSGDARIRAARFPKGMGMLARLALGIRGPRNPILGFSFAGKIEEIAQDVENFQVGQRVLGMTGPSFGGYADYKLIRSKAPMIQIPENLDMTTAAALSFGGTTAIHYLNKKAQVKPGERVLILGASGQVGAAGVQIAKAAGAHVTAVCSAPNHGIVKKLGADILIDYAKVDFTKAPETYDVIMDCVGASRFGLAKHTLNENGRYLVISGDLKDMIGTLRPADKQGRRAIGGVAGETVEDLATLISLWENGKFDPLVTKTYPLKDAALAHALVDTGRKVGSIVLTLG